MDRLVGLLRIEFQPAAGQGPPSKTRAKLQLDAFWLSPKVSK
jgi:hypothetical protein